MEHGPDGTDGIGGKLVLPDETFAIRGAIFEVYKALGAGFLEAVYQECLAMEFASAGIPFRAKPQLRLSYRGRELRQTYAPDFVCFGRVILELKAATALAPEHRAQTMN